MKLGIESRSETMTVWSILPATMYRPMGMDATLSIRPIVRSQATAFGGADQASD
jgi:hypothetical protein